MGGYVPRKGDFVFVTFDPQSGHEQKGRRPALVVSNDLFNKHTGLAIVCPLTNTDRGFPFHIAVTDSPIVTGFVMVEQVKSIDFRSRSLKPIGRASESLLEEVLSVFGCLPVLMSSPGNWRTRTSLDLRRAAGTIASIDA